MSSYVSLSQVNGSCDLYGCCMILIGRALESGGATFSKSGSDPIVSAMYLLADARQPLDCPRPRRPHPRTASVNYHES